jgi:predicted HTH domain antitoxin
VKLEIDIPISEDALNEEAKVQVRRSVIEAAVLRLFEERRISSAEATRKLGLTRIQFMELTRRRAIPHYDYTAEDLAADGADLDAIESELPHPARRGE